VEDALRIDGLGVGRYVVFDGHHIIVAAARTANPGRRVSRLGRRVSSIRDAIRYGIDYRERYTHLALRGSLPEYARKFPGWWRSENRHRPGSQTFSDRHGERPVRLRKTYNHISHTSRLCNPTTPASGLLVALVVSCKAELLRLLEFRVSIKGIEFFIRRTDCRLHPMESQASLFPLE
jgi:hypothetical protein